MLVTYGDGFVVGLAGGLFATRAVPCRGDVSRTVSGSGDFVVYGGDRGRFDSSIVLDRVGSSAEVEAEPGPASECMYFCIFSWFGRLIGRRQGPSLDPSDYFRGRSGDTFAEFFSE
jgi:hypothetical protein